tara:strand:+ start:1482 stop:2114 length:633 start_codon:yes stop_codon:yes gene_type:complete
MKKILVSQRVDYSYKNDEKRNSLDQRWTYFLLKCNLFPIFLSNDKKYIEYLVRNEKFDGIILTGGNNISNVSKIDNYSERDQLERFLINYSIRYNIPILGVCRGMQMIQDYFGVKLKKIKGHNKGKHKIFFNKNKLYSINQKNNFKYFSSYHNYGTTLNSDQFKKIAYSHDNIVEAIHHKKLKIYCQMWHPERNIKILDFDIKIFKRFFY